MCQTWIMSGHSSNVTLTPGTQAVDAVTLVRHALTTPAWTAPPATAAITTTDASWSAVTDATAYSVEYIAGSTSLLSVTSMDGSTSFTNSPLVPIPAGALAKVNAIGAPGLDLRNFALDHDGDLVTMLGLRAVTVR